MLIDGTIVQAYISGADMREYKNEWFFSSSTLDVDLGKNIFVLPPDDHSTRESVREMEQRFRRVTENFEPVNRSV